MKKNRFIFLALLFTLTACSGNLKHGDIDVDSNVNSVQKTGELSSFRLLTPTDEMIVDEVKFFSWEASNNATHYTLEISSSDQFQSDIETVDYYRQDNIVGTSFTINSAFQYKEINYYWRVTAKNATSSKLCEAINRFYIKAPEVNEFQFDLGEADDWSLHELGSPADISIDNNNFFGNGEKSLKIAFKEEYTKRGIPESDGWIVVTKVVEKSIYGTDALYFNCFYAGQDTTVFLRLIDRDNEFWHCPIQLSYNAQQSVILKFSDFVQRTGDVIVANETFDFERIKYMEVVFEKTFGDGVFLLSNVKAIKFSNYKHLFIDKLNFSEYASDKYECELGTLYSNIVDDYELVLNYYATTDEEHKKINGYDFLRLKAGRYMATGDALKVTVKYSGPKGKNIIIRIYEEDTDRWSYMIPFASLNPDEYTTLIIPYSAFGKSSISADGKRQFYYIINIQFGLEGMYSTGQIHFKDIEVVNKADYAQETARKVGNNGLIEDFNTYRFAADMFRIWNVSDGNKDEYMALNSTYKIGGDNTYCGELRYKAGMEASLYYLPVDCETEFTSISLWLKDASIKSDDARANYLDEINADVAIYIRLRSGEVYVYELKKLDKVWKQYDLPFSEFKLSSGYPSSDTVITAGAITHIGIGMQCFYYDVDGKPIEIYTNDNPVYVDQIYFTNYEDVHITVKDRIIVMEDNVAMIDDFESYTNSADVAGSWNNTYEYDYQHVELSDNVSKVGGNHSMKLQYKTKDKSPGYYMVPAIDKSVTSKVFKISIASEFAAIVYVNIYVTQGDKTTQYRATITSINTEWTEYVIGFGKMSNESGTTASLTSKLLPYISKISIGVVYNQGDTSVLSNIYVDNFAFDNSYTSYSTNTKTVIS